MVAKTYQGLKLVGEPYVVNGRSYIKVELANGNQKQVRWYTPKEYARYYGEPVDPKQDPFYKPQKVLLGFVNGFITIFKGDTYANKDWFKENGARYTRIWGWAFSSDMEIPELPEGIEAIRLNWEDVCADADNLKNDTEVQKVIDGLMYEPSISQYQGKVGERLELELTVDKAIHLDGYYGPSTLHTMSDSFGNVYVWTTASKSWEEGSVHSIRGTVKDHREFRNCKQTVLTRCTEIKKK